MLVTLKGPTSVEDTYPVASRSGSGCPLVEIFQKLDLKRGGGNVVATSKKATI